jgi:hypothetical protein
MPVTRRRLLYGGAAVAGIGGTVGALGTALAKIQQPALYKPDANGNDTTTAATFQGFTSYGNYVYLLDGDARTTDPAGGLSGADRCNTRLDPAQT